MTLIITLSVGSIFGGIANIFMSMASLGQYMLDFLVIFGIANIVWGFVLWLSHSIKFLDFAMRIGRSVVIFLVVFVLCNVFHVGLW